MWVRFKESWFYDTSREEFSRTATMNALFFFLAVITWVGFGVLVFYLLLYEKQVSVPLLATFLGFVTTITGGGFLQYSWGKKEQRLRENSSE